MSKLHFLMALGLFAACGGGGDDVNPEDFPDQFLDATCANAVECEAQPDTATCRASVFLDDGQIDTLLNAVAAGTVDFDGDAAAACVDARANAGCEFPGFYGEDPCSQVFTGTLARGAACIVDAECQGQDLCTPTDSACDPDTACCPGTCTAGVTIVDIGGTCGDDLVCDSAVAFCSIPDGAATGTCTAPNPTEGAACVDLDGCANPMYCDLFAQAATCTVAPGTGEDCSNDELLPCTDSRDFCDDVTGKCVAAVDVGGACDETAGTFCVGFAACVANVCVDRPSIGETCDTADDQCLGSLSCVGTSCAAPTPSDVCN
jgi:hypothetical protein